MISLDDFKKQWKTFLIGVATVVGIGVALLVAGLIFGGGIIRRRRRRVRRRHSTSSSPAPARSAAEPSPCSSSRKQPWASA